MPIRGCSVRATGPCATCSPRLVFRPGCGPARGPVTAITLAEGCSKLASVPATRARIPGGIGRIGPGLAAVLAWSLIGLGNAVKYGVYTPLAITLVSAGMVLLTVAVFGLRAAV